MRYPDGRVAAIANFHATGSKDKRIPDAEVMRAAAFVDALAAPDEVAVLAGDFNITAERSLTLRELTGPEWGFSSPGIGIDHVLVRGAEASKPERWPIAQAAARRRRGQRPCAGGRAAPPRRFDIERTCRPSKKSAPSFPCSSGLPISTPGRSGRSRGGPRRRWRARLAAELEGGRGGIAQFLDLIEVRGRVRAALAALIHVPVENVSLTSSTTDGCNIVLGGLELGPDDEIVTTDVEHFGLVGPLGVSQARVRVASVRDRPAEQAFDLIRAEVGPRTRLLALSHVAWTTGHVLPLRELKEATGLPVLVDGAQSVGAIPVEAGRSTSTRCPARSGSAGRTRPARCTSPTPRGSA